MIKIAILLLGKTSKLSNHDNNGERGASEDFADPLWAKCFLPGEELAPLSAVLLWACPRDNQRDASLPPASRTQWAGRAVGGGAVPQSDGAGGLGACLGKIFFFPPKKYNTPVPK